jgi:hypothetical protein
VVCGEGRFEMKITVRRNLKTNDGYFGKLSLDVNPFTCCTVENLLKAIPAGIYKVNFTYSARFQRVMPHIIVPVRDAAAGGDAGIRFHSANYPSQLEGCIAVGNKQVGDAVEDSKETFVKLFGIIKDCTDLTLDIA